MSYQLIYTKSRKTLNPKWWERLLPMAEKYGIVARSRNMPKSLVENLVSCSRFNYGAEAGMAGPQYAYRVDIIGGHMYHILSSVRRVKHEDQEQESYIAQHLALKADEVQRLWRNMNYPSPAGVMMALEKQGFWLSSWDEPPCWLEQDFIPQMHENMGETEQATWASLTGHKSNALAFHHEPYNRGCLVVVPVEGDSKAALTLLHESDVLTTDLGWGRPFCTHGFGRDVSNNTMRVFTTDDSGLVEKACEQGIPVLNIFVGLDVQQLRRAEAQSVKAPAAPEQTQRTASTNFMPVVIAPVTHAPRKRNWLLAVLRSIGKAIIGFILDVKDFVVSILMGVFIVALVAGSVGGLIYLFIRYVVPAMR